MTSRKPFLRFLVTVKKKFSFVSKGVGDKMIKLSLLLTLKKFSIFLMKKSDEISKPGLLPCGKRVTNSNKN